MIVTILTALFSKYYGVLYQSTPYKYTDNFSFLQIYFCFLIKIAGRTAKSGSHNPLNYKRLQGRLLIIK